LKSYSPTQKTLIKPALLKLANFYFLKTDRLIISDIINGETPGLGSIDIKAIIFKGIGIKIFILFLIL